MISNLEFGISYQDEEAKIADIRERVKRNKKFLRISNQALLQGFTTINNIPMIFARLVIVSGSDCRLECFDWRSEEFERLLKVKLDVKFYNFYSDLDLFREIDKFLKKYQPVLLVTKKLFKEIKYYSNQNPIQRSVG